MKKYAKYIYVIAMIVVLGITVGFAALVSEMSISNIVAEVRLKKDIRVTDMTYSTSTSSASVSSVEYSNQALLSDVVLPNSDSSVTYKVEVTNFGNVEMGIYEITGLPDNLTYEVKDYTLKEKICDSNNSCASGIVKDFYITIKYKSSGYVSTNTIYSLDIKIDFRQFYTISYDTSITNNGYQTEIINGDDLVITFTNPVPSSIDVYVDGLQIDSSLYTYENGVFRYNDVAGNVAIKNNTPKTPLYSMMRNATNGPDTNINFSSPSSATNGDGVNTVSGTESDEYPIYYYRGAVENNNVIFANFCWKIVRTTETGGIKLIYNGVPATDGSCNNTGTDSQLASKSAFNSNKSPADLGYMYGTKYTYSSKSLLSQSGTYLYGNKVSWDGANYTLQDTYSSTSWSSDSTTITTKYRYTCFNSTGECSSVYYIYHFVGSSVTSLTLTGGKTLETAKDAMFTNTTNSKIKTVIDNWYAVNMTSYTSKLENTIWCNDRSFYSGGLAGENVSIGVPYFGAYGRILNLKSPSLTCPNQNDSFTLSVANGGTIGYGNNALQYPVGLLTADELSLAGNGTEYDANTSCYLYTGQIWLSLSPAHLNISTYLFGLNTSGKLSNSLGSAVAYGVRPSISLKPGTLIAGGDGTASNPYFLEEPNIITFTISGTQYQALEGMTWREWIDSEYNTDNYIKIEPYFSVFAADMDLVVIDQDEIEVKLDDRIIADYIYRRHVVDLGPM